MNILKKIVLVFLIFSLGSRLVAQERSVMIQNLDRELESVNKGNVKTNNISRVLKASSSKNSFTFMYLGPVLDAFNNMYEFTQNEKYLKYSFQIIKNVIDSSQPSKKNKYFQTWYVSTNQERYKEANNNEWMLFEGHFFRYVVQYLYLVEKNATSITDKEIIKHNSKFIDFVYRNVWRKWLDASENTRGDLTLLYGVRVHNGAHWATIAKYLERLTKNTNSENNKFKEFYQSYDYWLRRNLRIVEGAYIWNSTWDNPFLKAHKERLSKGLDDSRIQDTAHGNHVMQYIISSYKINNYWTRNDLDLFSNTLLKKVLSEDYLVFDFINGTGKVKYLDLSDGWFKLSWYNNEVRNAMEIFYNKNKIIINKSHQNLQFYSISAFK